MKDALMNLVRGVHELGEVERRVGSLWKEEQT